jgi:hypothetical protein
MKFDLDPAKISKRVALMQKEPSRREVDTALLHLKQEYGWQPDYAIKLARGSSKVILALSQETREARITHATSSKGTMHHD